MFRIAALGLLLAATAYAGGGFTWLGGVAHTLHVPQHTVTFAVVSMVFLAFGFIYRLKTPNLTQSLTPDPGTSFRNIYEYVGEFVYNLGRDVMGENEAKRYFPVVMIYFTLIFMNNVVGVIPGFLPPTDNLNTTLAMGLFVFLYYNYQGIRVQGVVGHIKHFMGPVVGLAPLMFVIELISHTVRPISLGLRLKGNMEGDHLVLGIFSDLVPYIIPIPFYALGIFVSFIQAFVFTLLTMIYIGTAVEHHDHGDH